MDAELCFRFKKAEWNALRARLNANEPTAWEEAIGVFERRIRERFLSSIEALIAADSKPDLSPESPSGELCIPGFSIMALCCLLIDTLQGFQPKLPAAKILEQSCTFPIGPCIKPPSGTADQFKSFLRRPAFQNAFDDDHLAAHFVKGVRNGIIHDAETRKWVIWRDEPTDKLLESEDDGFTINRTMFYGAVKAEFESYLRELRNPSNLELPNRFKTKMNDLCRET